MWKPVLCCYLVLYMLKPFDALVTLTLKASPTGIVYLVLNVIHKDLLAYLDPLRMIAGDNILKLRYSSRRKLEIYQL